jgi:hypothetical protein
VVKVRNLAVEWRPFKGSNYQTLALDEAKNNGQKQPNVGLSRMCLPGTNTLAYFAFLAVTKKKNVL